MPNPPRPNFKAFRDHNFLSRQRNGNFMRTPQNEPEMSNLDRVILRGVVDGCYLNLRSSEGRDEGHD